jgi:hypothetical protein
VTAADPRARFPDSISFARGQRGLTALDQTELADDRVGDQAGVDLVLLCGDVALQSFQPFSTLAHNPLSTPRIDHRAAEQTRSGTD